MEYPHMLRNNWQEDEIAALFSMPFMDLLYQAHQVHRANFETHKIQLGNLLSIKTGACPEDCAYCPQSGHYQTGIEKQKLMALEEIEIQAKEAKRLGATRFCMGAAWRNLPADKMIEVAAIIKKIKALNLEVCMTLGMLTQSQANALAEAGLDYYNHNLDTSPEYYSKIITTRTYQDRLKTISVVQNARIKVCCGGIIGMGEARIDRIRFLQQLANLEKHPESVPINFLIPIEGTPLAQQEKLDIFEFIRVIAVARIMMPKSIVRISAGREEMSQAAQAWCIFAGANSFFLGDKLLTANNASLEKDEQLFAALNLSSMEGTRS